MQQLPRLTSTILLMASARSLGAYTCGSQSLSGDFRGDVVEQGIERPRLDFYLGEVKGLLDPGTDTCCADIYGILGSLPGPQVRSKVLDDRSRGQEHLGET